MKTITIGDLHGSGRWKAVDPHQYDKIIFLGDYLDSFTISGDVIVENFMEIIQFRQAWPEKVVLLLGNHEISYLDTKYMATGYRYAFAEKLEAILREHSDLFLVAWQHSNYLWSHAGLHQRFYDQKILPQVTQDDENLAATLQRLYKQDYPPIFEIGHERGGSRKNTGGPLWIDKKRLIKKPLQGYHQIVGHNSVKTIKHYFPDSNDPETSVTFCDCVERGDEKLYELII